MRIHQVLTFPSLRHREHLIQIHALDWFEDLTCARSSSYPYPVVRVESAEITNQSRRLVRVQNLCRSRPLARGVPNLDLASDCCTLKEKTPAATS